jgi:hypothetical protein
MFVDGGGWRRPAEPPRKRALTRRQESILLWLILVNVLIALVAPIGGGTIVEALMALSGR